MKMMIGTKTKKENKTARHYYIELSRNLETKIHDIGGNRCHQRGKMEWQIVRGRGGKKTWVFMSSTDPFGLA